jgi:hypothetical protein
MSDLAEMLRVALSAHPFSDQQLHAPRTKCRLVREEETNNRA